MFSPGFVFSFILATLSGAVFHFIFGGDARRFALFLLAGWIGFGLGHLLGVLFEINLYNVGSLRFVTAVAGAIFTLSVAHMLTSGQTRRRVSR